MSGQNKVYRDKMTNEPLMKIHANIGDLIIRPSTDRMHPGCRIEFKSGKKKKLIAQIEIPQDPDFDLDDAVHICIWDKQRKENKMQEIVVNLR